MSRGRLGAGMAGIGPVDLTVCLRAAGLTAGLSVVAVSAVRVSGPALIATAGTRAAAVTAALVGFGLRALAGVLAGRLAARRGAPRSVTVRSCAAGAMLGYLLFPGVFVAIGLAAGPEPAGEPGLAIGLVRLGLDAAIAVPICSAAAALAWLRTTAGQSRGSAAPIATATGRPW